MTRLAAVLSLLTLAACGLDGEPTPPEATPEPQSRVGVGGYIGIGSGGSYGSGGIGIGGLGRNGNISVGGGF